MGNRKPDKTGRSTGAEPHVRLHYWLLNTEAWKTLDPVGRAALVVLYQLFNGKNNGELFLSARELGKRINTNRGTANRALWALQARGFVRPYIKAGYDYKAVDRERRATSWVLTEFKHGTQDATKEFREWKPGDDYLKRIVKPAPWKRRKPGHATVTNCHATVTATSETKDNVAICHSPETDEPRIAAALSLHSDSDNHHARAGGAGSGSGRNTTTTPSTDRDWLVLS